MGSVDQSDQLISSLNLRVMKWYKKVMFNEFYLAELQRYLLYRKKSEKHVPHRVYRRELIKQMLPTCKIPLDVVVVCPFQPSSSLIQVLRV